jgi:hypothetical protein
MRKTTRSLTSHALARTSGPLLDGGVAVRARDVNGPSVHDGFIGHDRPIDDGFGGESVPMCSRPAMSWMGVPHGSTPQRAKTITAHHSAQGRKIVGMYFSVTVL